ncbi:MAG: phosphoglycerate dehydrogenase [Rhodothermaceae bacterium]|nr:phosphoglycerate dehydrogenase [Rhodothermaceae bacterium]
MFKVRTFNTISSHGLDRFPTTDYVVGENVAEPDAILLRSRSLHGVAFPNSVLAVARCGAGVNNIPIETCSDQGIVVFNTPGANANSVKELVICGMLLASRRIVDGINWARSLKDGDVAAVVEKGKKNFKGPEIMGKTLGVIGLGAIGVAVANAANALGMRTLGYDPFISVSSAWGLSREVTRATGLEEIIQSADYITLHVPLNDKTRDLINASHFARMKTGVRLLNFARGPLVNEEALFQAFDKGTCACYVTDFVDARLAQHPKVIPVPHLGASTSEAEDNCAVMAAEQICNYLEHGTVKNSVNFPEVTLPPRPDGYRIQVVNRNEPRMISQLATVLAGAGLNIDNLVNKGRGALAYNVIDIGSPISCSVFDQLAAIDGVVRARVIAPS